MSVWHSKMKIAALTLLAVVGLSVAGYGGFRVFQDFNKTTTPQCPPTPAYVLPGDKPIVVFSMTHGGLFWSKKRAFIQSYSTVDATPKTLEALNRTMDAISFEAVKDGVRVQLDAPVPKDVQVSVNGQPLTRVLVVPSARVRVQIGHAYAVTGKVVTYQGALKVLEPTAKVEVSG